MKPVPPLPPPEEFAGRVAVITGGTDGLGLDLARRLVALGCQVFLCGRDEARGEGVEHELGPLAHFVRCDLADPAAAAAFARTAGAFSGWIDYLVNNAAVDPRGALASATVEEFDRLIAINLRPHFLVTQAALPYLEAGEGKAVVNMTTTNYRLGLTPFALYNASKSGIVGLTRSLARELGPLGIRVNAVSPGWIMTQRQIAEHVREGDREALLEAQCIKTLLTEEHVTPVTLFLLSSAAAGVSGQEWIVDGGKVHG